MAVHIRLSRHGTKKTPFYRIVVTDHRNRRDGRFLENLGTWNPISDPVVLKVNRERLAYWTSKGALPSQTLAQILKRYPEEAAKPS